jgi:hypothetical protein
MLTLILNLLGAGGMVLFGTMLYKAFFRRPKKLKENQPYYSSVTQPSEADLTFLMYL